MRNEIVAGRGHSYCNRIIRYSKTLNLFWNIQCNTRMVKYVRFVESSYTAREFRHLIFVVKLTAALNRDAIFSLQFVPILYSISRSLSIVLLKYQMTKCNSISYYYYLRNTDAKHFQIARRKKIFFIFVSF